MFNLIFKLFSKIEKGMDKSYLSEADKKLNQESYIQDQPSDSQVREIKKHQGLYQRKLDSRVKWD